MRVGIEALNFYAGNIYINVRSIFEARNLALYRFDNLMLEKKAVALPCEDPITFAVNAAKPIIDRLSEEERNRIKMIITSSESGIDFGKSMSTYIHKYLGLNKNCRLFEIKQACYGGTAALQMAASFIASQTFPGAKVLIIATDISRTAAKNTYAEPSQAAGASAMLVSDKPHILEIELGASGFYSYEVMDACRPLPEEELGDSDLSLLSYLDCLENSYKNYRQKVGICDFLQDFDFLSFHAPFGGMVKGAHRKMMRDIYRMKPDQIDDDFKKRVLPSLKYCVQVGNVYSATLYLAILSMIDNSSINGRQRVGLFSYGSGCSSEFFSGYFDEKSKSILKQMNMPEHLEARYELSMDEYEEILDLNLEWMFGVKNKKMDFSKISKIYNSHVNGKGLLMLKEINNYHREYIWS